MNFAIGDKVRIIKDPDRQTGEVVDRVFSDATQSYMYIVKKDSTNRKSLYTDEDIELIHELYYSAEVEILENVVVGIVYEINGDEKIEVARGHGHIIHNGAQGIVQATSYAFKRAWMQINPSEN